ncbi:MAG: hypothetical protein ACRD68_10520, partial [Pyrinomonadaceae bacterium]
GEVSAQTAGHRRVQSRRQQAEALSSARQIFEREGMLKTRRGPTGLYSAPRPAAADTESFDLGFAFVSAMCLASRSHEDAATNAKAIVELAYLIERLESRPEEAAALQKVLRMVVRGSGTGMQRGETVQRVMKSYGDGLKGEAQWYFNSGVTVSRLFLATYLNDGDGMRIELQNLQLLTKIAPQNVPRDVLAPMQSLLRYFDQTTFTEGDRAAVIEAIDKIIVTVMA